MSSSISQIMVAIPGIGGTLASALLTQRSANRANGGTRDCVNVAAAGTANRQESVEAARESMEPAVGLPIGPSRPTEPAHMSLLRMA
ncbi:hypothetical protein [Streptomyces sp. NPDC001833]|uniref:hypothetical protein n=1 Tax=Streptomyces sp. NPDC001833 TaxID=3154658 RepID=UPI0033279D76